MVAHIIEEKTSPDKKWKIEVLEHQSGSWEGCIAFDEDDFGSSRYYTPARLKALGKWLIAQADRIGNTYDSKGRKKMTATPQSHV